MLLAVIFSSNWAVVASAGRSGSSSSRLRGVKETAVGAEHVGVVDIHVSIETHGFSFIFLFMLWQPLDFKKEFEAEEESIRRNLKGTTSHGTTAPTKDGPDVDVGAALGISCFSKDMTVTVQGRKNGVPMQDLQVGDRVLTARGSYGPVYAFGHYLPQKEAEFLQIYTTAATKDGDDESHQLLEMTGEHLVYVSHEPHPVRADSVQEGDYLLKGGASRQLLQVIRISSVVKQGLYAPLTPQGTVVVNGVVASSYVSLQKGQNHVVVWEELPFLGMSQHDYVHCGLAPLRLLCMGVSSRYCTSYDHNGMPWYAALAVDANEWIFDRQPHHARVRAVALGIITLLTGICLVLECIFGPSLAPLAVCSMALGRYYYRRCCQKQQIGSATLWLRRKATGGSDGLGVVKPKTLLA